MGSSCASQCCGQSKEEINSKQSSEIKMIQDTKAKPQETPSPSKASIADNKLDADQGADHDKSKPTQSGGFIKSEMYERELSQKSEEKEPKLKAAVNLNYSYQVNLETNPQIAATVGKRDHFSFGPTTLDSGAVYEGQWRNGMRDGKGKQTWPDGSVYIGDWKEDKSEGHGKLVHADGDIYDGSWLDDKANGQGSYMHVNGAHYIGEVPPQLTNDSGKTINRKGMELKIGQIRQSIKATIRMVGNMAKVSWILRTDPATKVSLEIVISREKVSTYGLINASMKVRQYLMQGRSVEQEQDAWLRNHPVDRRPKICWSTYSCQINQQYQDDRKHGYGVFSWGDGRRYIGYWQSGKQSGLGMYYLASGEMKVGEWQEGRRQKWYTDVEISELKVLGKLSELESHTK